LVISHARIESKPGTSPFLEVAKKKHPRIPKIRKAIKEQQLGHLKRNLSSIDVLVACDVGLLEAGRYA
jgi:hypothetical protein